MQQRLTLSRSDAKLAGVCGGFAKHFDKDPTFVRLIFVLLALLTAVVPMFVFYVIAWMVMPNEGE